MPYFCCKTSCEGDRFIEEKLVEVVLLLNPLESGLAPRRGLGLGGGVVDSGLRDENCVGTGDCLSAPVDSGLRGENCVGTGDCLSAPLSVLRGE